MKTVIMKVVVCAAAISLCSCYVGREIQVSMVDAELVKIDTINRYTNSEQVLVWKCSDNVEYVCYAPLYETYKLGSSMKVMVRR